MKILKTKLMMIDGMGKTKLVQTKEALEKG